MSESWFPGWSVSVDGHSATVLRTDAVALGVPVSAGRHEVSFRYRPPGFTAGATVSSLTFAGVLLAGVLFYVRRRRRRPGKDLV